LNFYKEGGDKIKYIFTIIALLSMMLFSTSCTEASKVSANISKEADNFNVIRRLTVINARTDKLLFEVIGQMSINRDTDGDLDIICEVGDGVYKKDFVSLNQWTIYVVEDLSGANVSPYKYEINYIPESIIPFTVTQSK